MIFTTQLYEVFFIQKNAPYVIIMQKKILHNLGFKVNK